jgi:hypothetical protein
MIARIAFLSIVAVYAWSPASAHAQTSMPPGSAMPPPSHHIGQAPPPRAPRMLGARLSREQRTRERRYRSTCIAGGSIFALGWGVALIAGMLVPRSGGDETTERAASHLLIPLAGPILAARDIEGARVPLGLLGAAQISGVLLIGIGATGLGVVRSETPEAVTLMLAPGGMRF